MPTPPLYTTTITGYLPTRIITHIGTQYNRRDNAGICVMVGVAPHGEQGEHAPQPQPLHIW
jgi:hypothetical protein